MKLTLVLLCSSLLVGGGGLWLAQADPIDSMWEVAEQVPALVVLVVLVRAFFTRLDKKDTAAREREAERAKLFTDTVEKTNAAFIELARQCHDVQRKSTEAHVESRKVTERLSHVVERLADSAHDSRG